MRKRLALTITALAIVGCVGTSSAHAKNQRGTAAFKCPGHVQGVYHYRGVTRTYEKKLGRVPSKSNFNASKVRSCKYVVWVAHTWHHRATKVRKDYAAYMKMLYASDPESVKAVICMVFGPYCSAAKTVAECESHFHISAKNGQYRNIFQMGSGERATYGWHDAGSPAIVAARSAYNYFVASGKDWSPWECKP